MPIVSPHIYMSVHTSPNDLPTGKQAFDRQEVSQRGVEIWRIVQPEGPLSRKSPASYLGFFLPVLKLTLTPCLATFPPAVSVSAVSNRLVTSGRQVPRCGRNGTRRAGYRDGALE